MQLDHLSFAAGPDGLVGTSERLSAALGVPSVDGGFHPRFGTRNRTIALAAGQYLEVVEVLDHPAADKMPFGQAVRERSAKGGGWLGWVIAVDDLAPVERRLERAGQPGSRHLPNGERLEWTQIGIKDLQNDPQLPFFVRWNSSADHHPSRPGSDVALVALQIAGDHERVDEWLGGKADEVLSDLHIEWLEPGGQPGIVSASFRTHDGVVRI